VGDYSKPPEVAAGRVVVNIYNDGKFYDDKENELVDMDAITDHVEQEKRLHKREGATTRLLIRGDEECKVEKVKQAVKAAADAGVIDVIFSSYQTAP
jgi:biopolymer transport protein ExbD